MHAIVVGLAAGAAIGVFNGALVAYGKLPPFIVTLGMLGIARGMVLVLTDASTVQPLPTSFANIANGDFLGLPNLLWIFVAVVVIASFVLRRTVFGRYIYAIGSNPESARLAGVPVTRVLVSVYALAGLLAAVGGVLFTSRLNAGIPTAGTGYELNAIAACVIGGASLFGAKGGAFGAAAGALIVGVLNNGGNLLAVNAFYLQIIIGALILAAVAFDQWQGGGARHMSIDHPRGHPSRRIRPRRRRRAASPRTTTSGPTRRTRPARRVRHVRAPRHLARRARSTRPTCSRSARRCAAIASRRGSTARCSWGATRTRCRSPRRARSSRCWARTASTSSSTPATAPRRPR